MKRLHILAIVALLFNSCDLLTTREPEEPNVQGSNYIPATSPEILFSNLESAMEEKILENYLSCIVDTSYLKKKFVFIYSLGSGTQYPVLSKWDIAAERQYFSNLKVRLGQASSMTVDFTKWQKNPQGGDSAIYSLDYSIKINSANSSVRGEYGGSAQFKIFNDSRKQWVIVEWQDLKTGPLPSWSDLKGRTY